MQNALEREIIAVAKRVIAKENQRAFKYEEYMDKIEKRTGVSPQRPAPTSAYHTDRHFDPVYCLRHSKFIARIIWRKCVKESYEPHAARLYRIPKADGNFREIMHFSIPDTALANLVNKKVVRRNIRKQSGNSFAYRPDRDAFDALLKIKSAIKGHKNFLVQIDFEKYFDSITHSLIQKVILDKKIFTSTSVERIIISSFVAHRFITFPRLSPVVEGSKKIGTPQGSSVSLVLANLANHDLDMRLEEINGQFARYADDTVVFCYSYEDAIQVYRIFCEHCAQTGLKLNDIKSPGISILSLSQEEMRSISDFKFLGYGINKNKLIMHEEVKLKLKRKFSNLINLYLLHYVSKFGANISRVGTGHDWDLIGLIYEIRNIIYGGLSEHDIRGSLKGHFRLRTMTGLMSFYALLEDREGLAELDGWLSRQIYAAAIKRYSSGLFPSNPRSAINIKKIISGEWYTADFTVDRLDARMPSFVRGWSAARKYYMTYGLNNVKAPTYVTGYI